MNNELKAIPMTPMKRVLSQIQQNEKTYLPMEDDKLMNDYIRHLQKKNEELVQAFTRDNFNLNLSKTFLFKLIDSHLTPVELKRTIKEFLNDLNQKP